MRTFVAVMVLAGALGGVAQAQPGGSPNLAQACSQEARRKVLSGDALTDFMNKCWAGQVSVPFVASPRPRCEEQAKLLSGEEKVSALRNCADTK